jgi:predicted DNA-binding protein (UPF0251 family)
MPRPQKERRVAVPPAFSDFKPTRVPKRLLTAVDLSLDEFEAIRLSDYAGLDHAAGADRMGVSRPTFTRLHEKARQKVAKFLVEGLNLSIGGGSVHFNENLFRCDSCYKVFPAPSDSGKSRCPFCKSKTISDLAASHGHGECCGENTDQLPGP